ncbi:MAG: hypothetical protein AAGJ82_04190 [Bacteroidota bacterium]
MKYYLVEYAGPFGYIKPWTAVRDGETFSQQFLTPSTVEGMEKKLFPELLDTPGIHKIKRYRLAYNGLSQQVEVIQGADYVRKGIKGVKNLVRMRRNQGILTRNVLVHPVLSLAFTELAAAERAAEQHLCLCRNEDLVYPQALYELSAAAFEAIAGFELLFGREQEGAFLVGYNRFAEAAPMYGRLTVTGNAAQFRDHA